MKKLFVLLLLLPVTVFTQEEKKVKNVILLIGDGMGLSQMSTAYYFNDGKPTNFSRFKHIGLINTSSAKEKITDSAAGATAFACGARSYNGAISVDTNLKKMPTLIEIIEKKDIKSGVVATSSITHATPACFYAHSNSRSNAEDIAKYLPKSGVDFFAGGGLKFFNKRSDKLDIYRELLKKGFILDTTALDPELEVRIAKKYGFLLADNGLESKLEGRGDFLKDATNLALTYLSKWEDGFFLMVEGSQIDWEGHATNAQGIIEEVKDFDKAMGEALNFAEVNANTLVIVTADHETGGFALSPKQTEDGWDYNTIEPKFYEGAADESVEYAAHTTTLIPVFAYGAGAEEFMGIYDNTEIFHKIMKLTGWNEAVVDENNQIKTNTPEINKRTFDK
ncbi:MAG: alkaline phosphatase [Crocinitomicaceae bacterium]|nr:alkaline phosphatase [Crocinitomicaceae bacterium]